jgi:hypothetical protein
VTNNTCKNNDVYGIYIYYSCDNNYIYHNNLVNNATQAYDSCFNFWDNGYPSGGNYWSDYTGVDKNHGENQNIPGSDGIGDTPYYISSISSGNNATILKDRYPLIPIPAIINISPTTLNLKSEGNWITCCIELPSGYDAKNINVSTVRLIVGNGSVPAELSPIGGGGHKLMVKFSRLAVQAIVSVGKAEATVIGEVDGIPFEGRTNIRVINQ